MCARLRVQDLGHQACACLRAGGGQPTWAQVGGCVCVRVQELGGPAALACAAARPRGAKAGSVEWHKAQVVQRNTSA